MANYNTRTKLVRAPISTDADTVTDSAAKVLNDYIQTLDETSGAIISITSAVQGSYIFYTIVHKG